MREREAGWGGGGGGNAIPINFGQNPLRNHTHCGRVANFIQRSTIYMGRGGEGGGKGKGGGGGGVNEGKISVSASGVLCVMG